MTEEFKKHIKEEVDTALNTLEVLGDVSQYSTEEDDDIDVEWMEKLNDAYDILLAFAVKHGFAKKY